MFKTIKIPNRFSFMDHGIYDFDRATSIFDWYIKSENVVIDFSKCFRANYQAMALLPLYIWHLNLNGCRVDFNFTRNFEGATKMWQLMGAKGWYHVLHKEKQNFKGAEFKPLLAIRNQSDFSKAISKAEEYSKGFNVEYEKTLRYVLTELLYNTLEHGKAFLRKNGNDIRIPSITQFTWYKNRNELQFIIADIGMGIKKHLEQTYEPFESHEEAIRQSIRPQVSGTFGITDPYKSKDNAGVGLYLSTNIVRRLNADMHIVSGDGVLHISPRDITSRTIEHPWPGTFVLVNVKLGDDLSLNLHKLMSEFRETAMKELSSGLEQENDDRHYINIQNYFGQYAEDKEAAIKYRDRYILPNVEKGKNLLLDFESVISAPHSFLSALLATPVKRMGMPAYKKIKVVNAEPEIRETIDYILDENT